MSTRKSNESTSGATVVPTTCSSHCGGQCVLKVHVKEGVITRIETDEGEEHQYRACLKGRAQRQRFYHPDRLLYPLKRTGERGKGEFKRISWDEALDTVASEIKRVREIYGPSAISLFWSAGDMHHLNIYTVNAWLERAMLWEIAVGGSSGNSERRS